LDQILFKRKNVDPNFWTESKINRIMNSQVVNMMKDLMINIISASISHSPYLNTNLFILGERSGNYKSTEIIFQRIKQKAFFIG
jgi:hypothetical protein